MSKGQKAEAQRLIYRLETMRPNGRVAHKIANIKSKLYGLLEVDYDEIKSGEILKRVKDEIAKCKIFSECKVNNLLDLVG